MATIIFDEESLRIDGEEFYSNDKGEFEVLASRLKSSRMSDLPVDVTICLCDLVGGSSDLYPRGCVTLTNVGEGEFVATDVVAFFDYEDEIDEDTLPIYFRESIDRAQLNLSELRATGLVIQTTETIHDDIAYLEYSVFLADQLVTDAEAYMAELQSIIYGARDHRSLFICHASEDLQFVERLVSELDKRALHVWYDKREILVGESIPKRINEGLSRAEYLVFVMSVSSISKPWVERELYASLMRQLDEGNIRVLPVYKEACKIPPLLRDLKYADFTTDFNYGLDQLVKAIRGTKPSS